MPVTTIKSSEHFKAVCQSAGSKLVVVDFTATWCGPCKRIAPTFSKLSDRFTEEAVFCKVDVDECSDIAQDYKIRCMPTFIVIRFSKKVGKMEGADEDELRELVESNVEF